MKLARWLLRGLLGSVLVVLVGMIGAAAWLASDGASAWVLAELQRQVRGQDIELRIGSSSGSLLGRLQLDDVHVAFDGHRFEAGRLVLHWRPRALLARRLHVVELSGDGLQLALAASADSDPAEPLTLPDIALPLPVRIDRLALQGVDVRQGDVEFHLDRVITEASLDADFVSLRQLDLRIPGAAVSGTLEMQATSPHGVMGTLRLAADASLTGSDVGDVTARLALSGPALQPALALHLERPTVMKLHGSLDLGGLAPAFDLDGEWDRLAWPLAGEPDVESLRGVLGARGTIDDYRLTSSMHLQSTVAAPADIDLQAHGDTNGLVVDALQIVALGGNTQVTGSLDWRDGIQWQAEADATQLDPAALDPTLPGEIGGRVRSDGRIANDGTLHWQAVVERFGGTLRGYPVALSGTAAQQGDQVSLRDVTVLSGPNRLDVAGSVGERLDLAVKLSAPQLQAVHPAMQGALSGGGRVSGTLDQPRVVVQLSGDTLAFDAFQADSLVLDVDWGESGGAISGVLDAVELQGRSVQRIEARVDGSPGSHRVTFSASADGVALALSANGAVREAAWAGTLQSLELASDVAGDWRLREPVKLRLSDSLVELGNACLADRDERLCAGGRWRPDGSIAASGRIDDLALSRLASLLPGDAVIDGRLDGRFDVSGSIDSPDLRAVFTPSDGTLSFEADDELIELPYREARAELTFVDDRGDLAFNLLVGPDGVGRGRLKLGPARPNGRALEGDIRAEFPDLRLLAGFVPALTEISGGFRVAATLAGSTDAPRVIGRMSIDDAQASVSAAGIRLEEIDLAVSGDGEGPLRLEGKLRSGAGDLRFDGEVAVAGKVPRVDIHARGENFQVARLPEATVAISPDLRLHGSGTYELSGSVHVPQARIEITELPEGSVSVSADQIIVGDDGQAESHEAVLPTRQLSGRVRVTLGDDITFKGFGLSTRLTGVMLARFDERGESVDGNIEMRDGRFKKFGQDLTIEQGRLIFAGPPDNPDVDLRAARLSRDGTVTAYLAMSGPLKKPRPRIYSEPSLPESEALAYLVTGRGLDEAGSGNNFDIASAAFALGVATGEPWLQDISDRLGVDDLRVETGENGLEESSLLIGKYLSPDIYVGYVQELFNPEGAVLVRLRLSEKIEVETRSGRNQSVDVIFRHEHN